jgi:hypothetical protein
MLAQAGKLVEIERIRRQPALGHRNRARRHDPPRQVAARMVIGIERGVAVPRPLHAGLATGMRQLNRRHRAIVAQEGGDPFQRRDLAVLPQPDVAMGDAAFRRDRGGLGHDDAGAALWNLPRCTRCQSLATPSAAEYWHIGEIRMRFLAVTPRRVIGWNNSGCDIETLLA